MVEHLRIWKIVHFLDVTFDLTDGSYKPYMKPNNKLSYAHQQSNHPPALLKNIPLNISKTTNYYKTAPEDYMKNVAKTYKKTNPNVPDIITLEDKKIAEKIELADRIEVSASRDSFIKLKDHKPDFINNPTCRLINPSKSEIGVISKNILDSINKEVIQATKVNLWKSLNNTIE